MIDINQLLQTDFYMIFTLNTRQKRKMAMLKIDPLTKKNACNFGAIAASLAYAINKNYRTFTGDPENIESIMRGGAKNYFAIFPIDGDIIFYSPAGAGKHIIEAMTECRDFVHWRLNNTNSNTKEEN